MSFHLCSHFSTDLILCFSESFLSELSSAVAVGNEGLEMFSSLVQKQKKTHTKTPFNHNNFIVFINKTQDHILQDIGIRWVLIIYLSKFSIQELNS